jgi:hypothetical protein
MFEHILAFYAFRADRMIRQAAACYGQARWDCLVVAESYNADYTRTMRCAVQAESAAA